MLNLILRQINRLMANNLITGPTIQPGNLIQLLGPKHTKFILIAEAGGEFHTHEGVVKHDDFIGKKWGVSVKSHREIDFIVLQAALDDLIRSVQRRTQIIYPKDIGYILMNLGVGPGIRIVECGTGSGGLTTAFAYMVGDEGHVYSYEYREEHLSIAEKNLSKAGLKNRVTLFHRNIEEGFDDHQAHALFLDLPETEKYIKQAKTALMPGGFFGAIVPTSNQVIDLIRELKGNQFAQIEVSEILHRKYKTNENRFRPYDRGMAHTGYLIFARSFSSIAGLTDD